MHGQRRAQVLQTSKERSLSFLGAVGHCADPIAQVVVADFVCVPSSSECGSLTLRPSALSVCCLPSIWCVDACIDQIVCVFEGARLSQHSCLLDTATMATELISFKREDGSEVPAYATPAGPKQVTSKLFALHAKSGSSLSPSIHPFRSWSTRKTGPGGSAGVVGRQ